MVWLKASNRVFNKTVLLALLIFIQIAVFQPLAYLLISFGLTLLHSAVSFGWMNAPAF